MLSISTIMPYDYYSDVMWLTLWIGYFAKHTVYQVCVKVPSTLSFWKPETEKIVENCFFIFQKIKI